MKSSSKSYITGAFFMVFFIGVFIWINNQEKVARIPWILRQAHELSEQVWSTLYREKSAPPRIAAAAGTPPRVNGDVGLKDPVDEQQWRLQVYAEEQAVLTLSASDLKKLPPTQTSTEFYCIEGWSTYFSYAGVKFSDFLDTYGLSKSFRYVNLQTPDKKYYVSIDMMSMLHEQTLLAYEMNERALSSENGAPLRLIIPIKYGIKSLKRIGSIQLSNTKGPDYWAERGYDWYSGL